MTPFSTLLIAQLLCSAFLSILFLQSGLDKIWHYQDNKAWLTEHFSKSPLSGMVGFLLPTITLLELAGGGLSLIGMISLCVYDSVMIGVWGALLSALALLALFFGQRIAKDYEGAGNLVPYFLLAIVTLYLLSSEFFFVQN